MWIAAAKTSDTGQVGRVVFRIWSEARYPGLGLDSGFNYVWQDVKNGKSREFVIPADPAKPVRSLVVTPHKHYKAPKWPRLLVVEREAPAAVMRAGYKPLKTYYALATSGVPMDRGASLTTRPPRGS